MNINNVLEKLDKLFSQNKLNDAELFLTQNLEQSISESDTGAIITILNELIGLYRDTSQYEKAKAYCASLEKLMISYGLEDTVHCATTYLNIANVYRASGDYEKSFEFYGKVRCIYDSLLDDNDYLNAGYYNNLSLLYQETGDFEKSCLCLEKALEIIKLLDAPAELASTYANLSLSYLHAGDVAKAEENALKSLEIFERNNEKDFHYSSALSAMADVMTVKKNYTGAAEFYEKALEELHRKTGYTQSYCRLIGNLENVSGEKFTGMKLAKQYYEKFGRNMIAEKFPDYEDKIAVGLVGEGSDCFGLDDKVSRDHDFGCGFCMWLTDEVYDKIGENLQREYDKLPEYFRGFPKLEKRRGVYRIKDFIKNLTGLENYPKCDSQWLDIPEYGLAALTNGEIFRDDSGIFSEIRQKYKYYPDNIRNVKLVQALAQAAQDGQYNYPRAMARRDILTARLHLNAFAENVIDIYFILNGKYIPHRKWCLKFTSDYVRSQILDLLSENPDCSTWEKYQPEEWYGRINYDDFHTNLIEKICSEISEKLGMPELNYLDFCAKEIFKMNIIKNIIKIEWEMFDKVKNKGGRAYCQDDYETFSIMRKSQYMTWNDELLESYLDDLINAENSGRNLISEKYAQMMKYTAPEEYAEISGTIPEITAQQQNIINQIAEIQTQWFEEFASKYPKLAGNARSIHSVSDTPDNTSYETYLKGELSVYSPRTLKLYGRFIVELCNGGKNLAEMTMLNTVILYGYKNLDDAENKI